MTIKKYIFLNIWALAIVALFCMVAISPPTARAYVAEQYQTDQKFVRGSLVTLDETGKFSLTNAVHNQFTGIVAQQTDSSFDLVSTGAVSVLVSDIDGDVVSGSRIGLSSINGVGSKWKAGRQEVGIALERLTSSSPGWTAISNNGKTSHIALISVRLDNGAQSQSGSVVTSLQRFAERLLNKPVAVWRVITALVIGSSGILLAFFLVASASRQAFVSLGRNPLASSAILRGLWRIVAAALAVVATSLLIAYLIASTG